MEEIKVGNTMINLSNSLFVKANISNVDPEYWYSVIYKRFPVYEMTVDIDRKDEDEDFDIYNKIFEDLVSSGEFTPLKYEYYREKSTDENDGKSRYDMCVNKFSITYDKEPIMVSYEYGVLTVMTYLGTEKINAFIEKYLMKYNQDYDSVKCSIIVKDSSLSLDEFDIDLNDDLDFDLYNEGFEDVHNGIVNSIKNDNNGLYFLYGKAGTGKTTYIRHLIKECSTDKRKFIYVPTKLFEDFTDPGFLPFLLENKGCVYIIEDCESLVTVDDGIRNESIADLLNMTDGLLADALNIKIICTFNSDFDKIDDALLRPGRCRCKYEFGLLSKERANKVAKKLKLKSVDKDVSLAELFNPDVEHFGGKKKKIGFSNR